VALLSVVQAIEKGLQRIKEAELMQQRIASISSNLGFLTTIYIGSKEGDSFNTNVIIIKLYNQSLIPDGIIIVITK
jgi:hypothetical protein